MALDIDADVLKIEPAAEADRIAGIVRTQVFRELRRRGAVVAISGGIDSSVVAALCVRALGKERVLGLCLPEKESSADSLDLSRSLAQFLGIKTLTEDITHILHDAGCYSRRDAAIRRMIPAYGPGYKSKIVLPGILEPSAYAIYSIVVESPSGVQTKARLTADSYLDIVAATNFKQRSRKMLEYHHADRLQYAVAGTPNRLEYDLGFFVKNGDGAADIKPIAHLYKSQVYQLAAFFRVPQEILRRPPTTDTYTLWQSQEEFYFTLPYDKMDFCLYGSNHSIPPAQIAAAIGLAADQVEKVYGSITAKRKAAKYLHMRPLLVEQIVDNLNHG